MNLSTSTREGQLAVDPPAAAVVVAGTAATVEARVALQLNPRPLKGAVLVTSEDPAFLVHEVVEVRRAERSVELEVHGEYLAQEPRAVTLMYSVGALSARQTARFTPEARPVAEQPRRYQRYVPFEDDEDAAPAFADDAPVAQRLADVSTEVSDLNVVVPPAWMRIGAALLEGIAAIAVALVTSIAVMFVAVIPYVAAGCESDPPPSTPCAVADEWIVNGLIIYFLAAIPAYHLIAAMLGRGIVYRMIGLRVICRGVGVARLFRDEIEQVRPGFLRGLLRTVVEWAGALCFGLTYLWMFTNPSRRTWHDLAAGTMVIRDRR